MVKAFFSIPTIRPGIILSLGRPGGVNWKKTIPLHHRPRDLLGIPKWITPRNDRRSTQRSYPSPHRPSSRRGTAPTHSGWLLHWFSAKVHPTSASSV